MLRILIVDDDEMILRAIRRMLSRESEWELSFATNGEEALKLLPGIDVLVTDMQMPGMNGAELLQRTQQEFPAAIRIVLSGHADAEATVRAAGIAHQFVLKPVDASILKQVITRSCAVVNSLDDAGFREIVMGIGTLPSAPRIHQELMKLIASKSSSADSISRLVETDPGLAAKLLQIVNSSFYYNTEHVTRTRDAVVRLGLRVVQDIVLMAQAFDGWSVSGAFLDELQAHSINVARLALALSDKRSRDEAFLAGLLHDLGKIIVEEHGLDPAWHAELGGQLLAAWGLPYTVLDAVLHHHREDLLVSDLGPREYVYLANTWLRNRQVPDEIWQAMGEPDHLAQTARNLGLPVE